MDTKTVYGMLIGDGALVGVSESDNADSKRYWYGIDDDDWCLVRFTVPEDFDAEGMVESGDMYTDADNLLANCSDWIVMDCGDRPYMSPFFVWQFGSVGKYIPDSWNFANFDGSVGEICWRPIDFRESSAENDCEDDDY